MVFGVFRGYVVKFAIIFVLHPRIEIMLVGKAVPEMIEWVKTGFAIHGNTKIDKARARVVGNKNILFALQVAVSHTAFMNRFDNCQHLREEGIAVPDVSVAQSLRFNILERQVAPLE